MQGTAKINLSQSEVSNYFFVKSSPVIAFVK